MRDIDRSQIIFAEREPTYEKHLSRYKLGDLLLDTFNYNGPLLQLKHCGQDSQ